MASSEYMLHNMSEEKLAATLKPYYDDFYRQLSESQKKNITFEQVVRGAYKRLRSVSATPLERFDIAPMNTAGQSACILAIGTVVGDAFGMVFQLLGIQASTITATTRALLETLGQDTLRGLMATIHDIANASSALDKAKQIWGLIGQVKNAIGLSGIVNALKGTMSWYQWVITGVTVVAQLTIWFTTDGAAFVAEVALEGVAIAQTVEDSIKSVNACSTS